MCSSCIDNAVAAYRSASVADFLVFEALSDEQKRAAAAALGSQVERAVLDARNEEVDVWYGDTVGLKREVIEKVADTAIETAKRVDDKTLDKEERKKAWVEVKAALERLHVLAVEIPEDMDA